MTFYSMEPFNDGSRTIPAGQAYMAVFKSEDGTFTVTGPDGQGIPPGKYRVSVTQELTRDAIDKINENVQRNQKLFDRDTDVLKGQFGAKSPIVLEIKDSTEVTIDLDKPTGSGAVKITAGASTVRADRVLDFLEGRFGPTPSPIIGTVDHSTNLVIDLDRPPEIN